jgi:hypothetical protein
MTMKIYMLLMLIALFVGFSYVPVPRRTEARDSASPDSLTAYPQTMSRRRI